LSLKLVIIQIFSCNLLRLYKLDTSLITIDKVSIKYPKISDTNTCRTQIRNPKLKYRCIIGHNTLHIFLFILGVYQHLELQFLFFFNVYLILYIN